MSGGADTKNKREQNLNRRIFGSILTVAVVVLLATLVLVTGFLYDYFTGVLERQMRDEWRSRRLPSRKTGRHISTG